MSVPDATNLLGIAREVLLETLLPALPPTLRYEARMIASAIAIAARETQDAAAVTAAAREQAAIIDLLALAGVEALPEMAPGLLCRAIRQGRYDAPGPLRDALLADLGGITRDKLRISNPRALAAAG